MIDRELEKNIKKTRDFIEIWQNFHQVFREAVSGTAVNEDAEKRFLATRPLVDSRYDDLMDSLGVKPIKRFIAGECIYDLLLLERLSAMSDEKAVKLKKRWEESFAFLSALLGRLERKKRRIKDINKLAFFVKQGVGKLR